MPALARVTDLRASHDAADVVSLSHKLIKARVESLLLAAGPNGLTDRELVRQYFAAQDAPQCDFESPRKRRSELTTERVVLTRGERRKFDGGRVAPTIWIHRKHMTERKHW
jgi:hypothetical protein